MNPFAFYILAAAWAAVSLYHLIDLLRYYQLEEYDNRRFLVWAIQKLKRVLRLPELLAALLLVPAVILPGSALSGWLAFGMCLVALLAGFVLIWRANRNAIKPLVYTARAKRLLAVGGLVTLLVETALVLLAPQSGLQRDALRMAMLFAAGQLTFLAVVLANLLLYPYEELARRYYIASARKVLAAVNPTVIGITGSYGKTSTKEILYHILSTRYDTLRTPRSFNTLMGVCKVIREELKPQHRFFIVEMGAYKSGEIEKICQLVRPKYGILTAVGPQHLERFKTVEAVARAKNELILALPPDGTGIFNADNPYCRQLASQAAVKALCYAMDAGQAADLRAENVVISNDGTRFDVVTPAGGERYPAKTALLGRYNVSNSLGAVLAARECGFTLKEALLALASAAPFSHRLQPVQTDAGIYTIDDSYNSNPLGAQMALEVLAAFPQGQKVLVTPGFAELGAIQAEEHEKLGRLAGAACDYVLLVGGEERTSQIRKGLLQTPIDPAHILCYNSLNQAKEYLAALLKPGDVVLFENDLPDHYL